jgi:hypothetical protein
VGSQIRSWSLIHNEKPIVLFEKRACDCACEVIGPCLCREMPVIPVNWVVDTKRIIRKMEG